MQIKPHMGMSGSNPIGMHACMQDLVNENVEQLSIVTSLSPSSDCQKWESLAHQTATANIPVDQEGINNDAHCLINCAYILMWPWLAQF